MLIVSRFEFSSVSGANFGKHRIQYNSIAHRVNPKNYEQSSDTVFLNTN